MTTIRVKFRPSTIPDKEGTIFYQVIHKRKCRQIHPDYHVFSHEWDENRSDLVIDNKSDRRSFLISVKGQIQSDIDRLSKIIHDLDQRIIEYSVDDIIVKFDQRGKECSLSNFMKKIISRLKENGKFRTSETYTSALKSFMSFLQDMKHQGRIHSDDIMLDSLNVEIMEAYESWQKKRGNTRNTVSFYTRILRAAYNRAVRDGLVLHDNKPFRTVYTGIDKTVRRALPIKLIKAIRDLDLRDIPELDYARDMFILSFMLRGMSFIDMAFLRNSDLVDGQIIYRRRKTGQQLIIGWTKEMQAIVDKYPKNQSIYLLPIIRRSGLKERYIYRNVAYNINHNLKRIAKRVGIAVPLTLYVARHSWASAAKCKGIPLSVISEGLGQESETTTQIYLAGLDTSTVDKANQVILSCL